MARHGVSGVIRLEDPIYGDANRIIGDNLLKEEPMNAYFLCICAGNKALTLNLTALEGAFAEADEAIAY